MKNLSKRITAAVLALLMAAGAGTSSLPFLSGADTSITASADNATTELDPFGDDDEGSTEEDKTFTPSEYYTMLFGLMKGEKWTVQASMVKAGDLDSPSMSDNAINHAVTITYGENGFEAEEEFVPLNLLGKKGYLKSLSYYQSGYSISDYGVPRGTVKAAEALSYYNDVDQYNGTEQDTDGKWTNPSYKYPRKLKFPLVDTVKPSTEDATQLVPLQVFVPVMAAINPSSGTQDVFMKIDWSTAEKSSSQITKEGFTMMPFVPVSGYVPAPGKDPNESYYVDNVDQLKNGRYKINAKFVDPATEANVDITSSFSQELELIVNNGSYYFKTDITGKDGDDRYIPRVYEWKNYRYDTGYSLTGFAVTTDVFSTYDVVDELNSQVADENGKYTKAKFKYPKKIGFNLTYGKKTNSKQYTPLDIGYVEKSVIKDSKTGEVIRTSYYNGHYTRFLLIDWESAEIVEDWTTDANYTAVDEALAKVPSMEELKKYTDESVNALVKAVNSVVRGYSASQQSEVDAMAKAINDAIAALEEKLADGKYTVTADMIKLNKTDKSMSDGAINHTVQIDVVNGEYYATMQFRGLAINNSYGFLKDLRYYDKGYKFENGKLTGDVKAAEVLKTQKYEDGSDYIDQYNDKDNLYPQTVKFKLVDGQEADYVPLQVFVPIMEAIATGNGTQSVFMKIDWSTLKKTDKDVEQDPPIKQSAAFDAQDEATGVSVHADKGVLPEGTKLVVTAVESGSDYDKADKALADTARAFDLYDISFVNDSNEPVKPNGVVSVSLPVNKAFTDKLGVYRIKDDGSKVAMSGEVSGGSFTFAFKSESNIKAALADKAEKTAANAIVRYAGKNRFATAAEISKNSFKSADNVVLAYGLDSADALAGVTLAAKLKAPLLLTNKDKLPSETVEEIKRLGAKNVTILGGTGAISDDVKAELEKSGIKTQRLAGKSRFGTAAAIAEKLGSEPSEVFFVYAFNYPDALSASAVAAIKGAPIVYLKTNGEIDDDTAKYLESIKGKVKKAYVIGGDGVISDDMMKKAGDALGLEAGKTVTRVAGKNRFATCIAVNDTFKDVLTGKAVSVATGSDFPDALAGGVFAAMNKTPLFLAGKSLDADQTKYLTDKKANGVFVFGGTGAVSDDLAQQIAKTTL